MSIMSMSIQESKRERLQLSSQFFKLTVELLHEFSWIYDFKATDILKDNVRMKVPPSFQDLFQGFEDDDKQFHDILNLVNNGSYNNWPPELNKFLKVCRRLRQLSEEIKGSSLVCSSEATPTTSSSPPQLPRKWNPKKYFEVVHVGNFVGELCVREKCDSVVDIGSGLGYLSSHLATNFSIPVIGIESVASRVDTANKSVESQPIPQKFICLRISANISAELLPHLGGYERICLTALHACGDLTPWSLQYFLSADTCKCIAVVPCCYHKMEMEASNFPLSSGMNEIVSKYKGIEFLMNVWLWRLASQRAGSDFLGDVGKETRNMFYRALLEKYCEEVKLKLMRKKRKVQDSKFQTFPEYLEKTIGPNGGFTFVNLDESTLECTEDMLRNAMSELGLLHDKLIGWSRVITGILAMQGAIQAIAEDLILLDRLSLLLESESVRECGIVKVVPDHVSPRGMVLFGVK